VRDNKLITPPVTASILESITRDTIIELAKKELQIEVIEREIDRTELYVCDEAFLCGSAMEVAPIFSVDGILIGDDVGELTMSIHQLYLDVAAGKVEAYKKWLTQIY
jgi:branched-chain amino acid aminotransferase